MATEETRKQAHDYARHSFGLFVQWFSFFLTANVAVLSWLAKDDANKGLAITVCVAFLVHNVIAALRTGAFTGQLRDMCRVASDGVEASPAVPPIDMYTRVAKTFMLVHWITACMWVAAIIIISC